MLWLSPMGTDNAGHNKNILSFKKMSKPKNRKYNNNFRKVIISNLIPDALRD